MRQIVVTGGCTGIGRAVAEHFIGLGDAVTALGLDADSDLSEEILYRELDVTNEVALRAVAAELDGIDCLVNCAGILKQEQERNSEVFDAVVNVNLNATFRACLVFRDKLANSRGAIVNIASMWSYFGSPKSPAYAASKTAITSLTRSCAVAWAVDGIRVNAVSPGWVETRITRAARSDVQRVSKITERIPLGRWAQPQDIVDVIAFLCSDGACYMTGTVLPVDGGYSIS